MATKQNQIAITREDLSHSKLRVLKMIEQLHPCTCRQVARSLSVSDQAVQKVACELVDLGLLEYREGPYIGRYRPVSDR